VAGDALLAGERVDAPLEGEERLLLLLGCLGGIGGSGAAFCAFSPWPLDMTALPPERMAPENALCSAFCSASNLDVFTDEMANSTMNRQKSRVIMSA
jgi:hypothetical protein